MTKKHLQMNLIHRTEIALSRDWHNDVCTLDWLTCRSWWQKKTYNVQFKSGTRVFGSISACLLTYKHSRSCLTHSCPWARSCVNFTSWLDNLREKEKSASPVPVSYEIKWLAKLSRKKLEFPFEVLEVFDDLFWLRGQEAGEGRSERKRDRGPWISDITNDWFSYLSVCANDPGCHSWVNSLWHTN